MYYYTPKQVHFCTIATFNIGTSTSNYTIPFIDIMKKL